MKMEDLVYNSAMVTSAILVVYWSWRVLDWLWFRPKRIEKILRKQGFKGNSYRFLYGDSKDSEIMTREANSMPTVTLSHHIVPRVIPFLHQTITKYGKASFIWFGWKPRVIIMNIDHIKEIYLKFHDFKRQKTNPLLRLFIYGLASFEGELWDKHRKIINPAFHHDKLKRMLPAFYLSCKEMVDKWEKLVSMNGSCDLNVQPYIETFASDALSRTSFGSSYEEGKRIFELQGKLAKLVGQSSQSIYIPGWRYLPTTKNTRMSKLAHEINHSIRTIIDNKMKAMKISRSCNDDFLGILLESHFEKNHNMNDALSIDEIIAECKQFYFAGEATTSLLLVWTIFLLSINRSWQERAREEVLQEFGNEKPDFEGLNRLKVVNMILYEVLRLYPPSVMSLREVEKETILGEILLPAGIQVLIPIMLIHRDKKIWGDDANEFNPKRFARGVSKATNGKVAYFPFGWGARICIGQNFAMLEVKLAIVMILQRFCFKLSSMYVHAPQNVVLLQPQYGVHITLQKLK